MSFTNMIKFKTLNIALIFVFLITLVVFAASETFEAFDALD